MDIEAQFQKDGEPDSDWFFVGPVYLHPEIRKGIEALLDSTYVSQVEVTYNISYSNVMSTKFRKGVVRVNG